MSGLSYRIADREVEFEAIHRLNYETFVEEIPQHPPDATRRLVDRFHDENVYAICMDGEALAGMVAGRCMRPFSLDSKMHDLDRFLPPHSRAVEIRLLAVRREYRHAPVFARLVVQLARHFRAISCDLAVISGTVRQLELYAHMGFRKFGSPVGPPEARFQPMYLTLDAWFGKKVLSIPAERPQVVAEFLPGPVNVSAAVREAFDSPPVPHRSEGFMERMTRIRRRLCSLAGASHVAVLLGTGTLANDAIAAQIRYRNGKGLVLSNGEFGERLVAHARGWRIRHEVARRPWGEAFDWSALQRYVQDAQPAWIWAVLSETSTGMTNSAIRLRALCECAGAALCLDAVSAVGLMPVDLRGTWLGSAVSGKGLGAYSGLAAVFHDGNVAPRGAVPPYLDLAAHEEASGVPYTQSSNLAAALDCALTSTRWDEKFQRIATTDSLLRARLRAHGLSPLVADDVSTRGIISLPLPDGVESRRVALALRNDGVGLAYESAYLRSRNWLQVCLMGEFDGAAVDRIPALLAAHVAFAARNSSPRRLRVQGDAGVVV